MAYTVQKKQMQVMSKVSHQVSKDIYEHYKSVIDEFYLAKVFNHDGLVSNKPLVYTRYYHFYDTAEPFIQMSNNRRSAIAGIRVSSTNIGGEPYEDSAEYVFGLAFNKGIHGIYIPGRVFKSASIKSAMNDWMREYKKKKNIRSIFNKYISML